MAGRVLNKRRHLGLQQLSALTGTGRTLLGPVKSPKFILDEESGESALAISPGRLLESLDVSSAAGQLLLQAVRAQGGACGSGSSTLLLLAGAWSRAAEECLQLGIPVSTIVAVMAEGLASCTAEAAALHVPVHCTLDPLDSAKTAPGPGEAVGARCPPTQHRAAAGSTQEERDVRGGAPPSPAADHVRGRPVQWPKSSGTGVRLDGCGGRPALRLSRHFSGAGGGPGADPEPKAGRCSDLEALAAGLSHGNARAMELAQAALRLQWERAHTSELARVCTCHLPGWPESVSGVCPGFVTVVPLAASALVQQLRDRPLRVVLIEGDLTETYRHPGFKRPTNTRVVADGAGPPRDSSEPWADGVMGVLARLRVGLVLARGAVCAHLAERCARGGRLVLGAVRCGVLQAFAEATGAAQVAYPAQLSDRCVGGGVSVAPWRSLPGAVDRNQGTPVLLKAEGINLTTAVLADPVVALMQAREDGFWTCASRLHCALEEGSVFLGGGAVEFLCLSHLQTLAEQSVNTERPSCPAQPPGGSPQPTSPLPAGRAAVLRGLASGWRAFLSALCCNTARCSSELEASAFIQRHVQSAADSGSPASYILREYSTLTTGVFHSDIPSKQKPTLRVYDPITPKVEAWRRALDLVLLVLQTDSEVITGPGHARLSAQELGGLLFL